MNESTIEIIESIGRQWKFLLTFFFIVVFILKWKTIWSFIGSLTQIRVKRGNSEIELHRDDNKEDNLPPNEKKINQDLVKPIDEFSDEEKNQEKNKKPNTPELLYFEALSEKNFNEAKKLFEEIHSKEKDVIKAYELKIRSYHWRYIYGDTDSFEDLERYCFNIGNNDEEKSYAFYFLGLINDDEKNYDSAIEQLTKAIELSQNEIHKTAYILLLSKVFYENENVEMSLKIILINLESIVDRKHKASLYKAIAEYYNKVDNKLLESIAYQKALELTPNNTSLLFDSAYSFGDANIKLHDLSLFLYKKLISISPNHSSGLNNIGVAYQNLNLNIKSIDFYKQGIENTNTLAISNIAHILINNGFKNEANEYLLKAKEVEDYHENIDEATSTLRSKIKNEKETEKKILKSAAKKYRFFMQFGTAVFSLTKKIIKTSNSWKLNNYLCTITKEKNTITLTWIINDQKSKITTSIINNALISSYHKPKKNLFSYSEDTKYTYEKNEGYGYIVSEDEILFLFEVNDELLDFKFTKE